MLDFDIDLKDNEEAKENSTYDINSVFEPIRRETMFSI